MTIDVGAVSERDFAATAAGLGELGLSATLALREFLLGNATLPAAAELAGMTDSQFLSLLARVEPFLAGGPVPADAPPPPAPRISVVVPVYNEEENLPVLYDRLVAVLRPLGSYEIVFVDDGSRDGSAGIVGDLERRDAGVRLVSFSRNFGHQAALSAGLDHARGRAVVLMDADLQDPPELLPRLVEQWERGYQLVYAVREARDEGPVKRATAHLFYRALRAAAEVDIPVDTGDFCLMDRQVVDELCRLPEQNRFLRGLRSWVGFRQTGVPYERPARHAGDVKYTARKMVKLAVDGMLAFSSLPLRLASYLGFLTAAAGLGYLGVAVTDRLTGQTTSGWASLVALILVVGGAQLIVTGVLGSYVARIYDETKRRPMYVVDRSKRPT
jgi:dolichol-phosphate mannosyltransferase